MKDEADPRDALLSRAVKPVIPLPRARLTGFGIALACGILGLGLFSVLDAKRRAPSEPQSNEPAQQAMIASPPDLAVPQPDMVALVGQPDMALAPPQALQPSVFQPQPAPQISSAPRYSSMPTYAPPPPQQQMAAFTQPPIRQARTDAANDADKILLMDTGPGAARSPNETKPAAGQPAVDSGTGEEQAVRATIIRNRASLVSQGTMIAAVLETPIHSSRPGMARALVTADVRGFDGTRVLIPRGSRLIGEARGDAQAGQKRVFVNWTRLIRPDGVAIRIGSPGADSLGGAGVKGSVSNHVLGRFANAILQTAFSIGINRASRSSGDSVILGIPGQAGGAITQVPVFNVPAGPSISVPQGSEISIFVAKDLDFGGAGARP